MPSVVRHLDQLSSMASISSRIACGRERDARDDHARDLVVLDLVVHARERQRELVVGVRDGREVRVDARHHLRRRVQIEVPLALVRSPSLLASHFVRYSVVAVGKAQGAVPRRPAALRQAAVALRARRRGRGRRRRGAAAADSGAGVGVPARQPREGVLLGGVRGLARGAPPGGARRLLRDRRRVRDRARARGREAVVRTRDASAPARPGGAASSSSIARTRSWPVSRTITRPSSASVIAVHPIDELRAAVEAAAGTFATATPPPKRARQPGAPQEGRLRRLLDERGDAAGARARRAAAGDRRAARGEADRAARRAPSTTSRSRDPASSTSSSPTPGTSARRARSSPPATAGAAGAPEHPEKVIVEFVSANPTGPLTAASRPPRRLRRRARAAARAQRPRASPASTTSTTPARRSTKLGASVRARARHEPVPEDGYQGDYVTELAARIPGAADERRRGARRSRPRALIMDGIRATLAAYRVEFDSYFLEGKRLRRRSLADRDRTADPGASAATPTSPRARCGCARAPTATTRTACSTRSTGAPTYFAADVAYHENKVQRGYDRLIDVLGADHHGYIGRMKGVMAALGHEADRLEIPILQFVHVVEGGEKAKMSKRRGDFVTLDELIDDDRRRRHPLVHGLALARVHDRPRPRAGAPSRTPRTRSTTSSTRMRGSPRSCATPSPALVERALAAEPDAVAAQRRRARADPQAAGVAGRGARGDRAARAAPDCRLRAGARSGLRRVLSRLAGAQGARRDAAGVPDRALRRVPTNSRRRARAARRLGPGGHVDARRDHLVDRAGAGPQPVRARRQPRPDPVQRAALRLRARFAAAHLRGDVRDHRGREARDAHARTAHGRRLHRRRVRRPLRGDSGRSRVGQPELERVRLAPRRDGVDEAAAARGRRRAARPGGARARRRAAADALLAADRLRALRAQVDDGRAQARRRPGAEGAGLRARLPGAGAGGLQGPGRQAAAGEQDDGPPLPLLHAGAGRSRPGRLPGRRLPVRARGGAPERALRRRVAAGAARALRRAQRDAERAGARVDR